MNGSPSAACTGNSSLTLKSLNEVKIMIPLYLPFFPPLWPTGSDLDLRGTLKHAHELDGDEPISMLIRFGTAVRRLPSLSLGCCVQQRVGSERENLCMLHAAERQCELGVEEESLST